MADWKAQHKFLCGEENPLENPDGELMPSKGSSEMEILSSETERLSPSSSTFDKTSTKKAMKSARTAMPITGENIVHPTSTGVKDFPETSLKQSTAFIVHSNQRRIDDICKNVIQDMDEYGVCLVDNFLGEDCGKLVLSEVLDMYSKGLFKDGQLVSNKGIKGDLKTIRGDQITWIDGREKQCRYIGQLISQVDTVIMRANKMLNNGKLGDYHINGRTKV